MFDEDESEEDKPDEDKSDDDGSGWPRKARKTGGDEKKHSPPGGALRSSTVSTVIPSVPFSSVSFGNTLGRGRNGCVFRADWQSVAVKQFDRGRPEVKKRLRNAIAAYIRWKHAQGILVPKALFWTQSKFGIAYLGLELGRMPQEGDDVSNWGQIIQRLRTEYGFYHGDFDGRNGVFSKANNQGDERLVANDLEEYTVLRQAQKHKRRRKKEPPNQVLQA